jgi:hypothetical protein
MLYVEHTFRFRRHPEIGADASPLTAQEIRDLDAYAAARHVQLVPSLQSLGHMDHVLELPRYQHLAETPRRWTLSPAEPESYALLRDLYDEYLPNFRSRLFNANCDESFDLGLGKSRERSEQLGPGGVFLEHVRRIRQLAAEHGKRTMIWADMVHAHPQRMGEIPRDVVLLDWWYEAECDYDRVARLAAEGLEFWVCPGTSSWNCLFPRIENAERNVEGWAGAARRHGAGGLLVTDWGDFGHYNLQGLSWFGYAWAAEQAWGGRADRRVFDRAFSARVFGDASGEVARLYRELGGLHAAGFPVFNGSPLQFLFFDDLDVGYFCEGVQAPVLRRTLRGLSRARDRVERALPRLSREALAWEELRYAADASIFAALKGIAGSEYVAWRRRPGRLDARGRRRLGRELAALAQRQLELGRELRRLWLARSRPSNLELTERRLAGSARSLRRAAAALAAGRPPAPPPEHPGFDVGNLMRAVTRSFATSGRA